LKLEQLVFDLHALVREITLTMRPKAVAKQLSFDADVAPDVEQWVTGDAGRLRQLLLNLLENAVKFTHVGSVNIRITRDPVDSARLLFRVHDTGVGIARDKQRDVFAVFSQVDSSTTRRYGGTGLGLAICERLTRAMGGEIRLESELGIGSTFSFSLRLEPGRAPDARGVQHIPAASPLALQVLVVDDNIVNLKVAVKLLERLGCSVQTAENGQEACEKVATGCYDAVLMDCMMPIMDGYSATRWLRANGVLIPIIAMTANNQPEDVERSKASGMNAHLAKPVKLDELAGTLRHCTVPA
jgi:CheY-like chemotaxis protein